jgi:uncharacterized membrane protein YgaE (UPF0421/DUF939 family)
LVAHRALGHPQPFFAPIAAAIALSTSHMQRSRRIVQMMIGVLLGIGVAEILVAAIGTSTVALGVIVFVSMLVASMLGLGFVGEGMMFVNQAAASAILVVALRGHGIGAERALDALIGGAMALLVGVVLFPAAPLPRLRNAERAVLTSLASVLERVGELLRDGERAPPDWTLAMGYEIHQQLGALAQARTTARANVRIAPRRWPLRAIVDAEEQRIARLDLLANTVLSLMRAATGALDDGESLPPSLRGEIAALATAIGSLAGTPQPWPRELVREIGEIANRAIEQAAAQRVDRVPVIMSLVRAGARDLVELLKAEPPAAVG